MPPKAKETLTVPFLAIPAVKVGGVFPCIDIAPYPILGPVNFSSCVFDERNITGGRAEKCMKQDRRSLDVFFCEF